MKRTHITILLYTLLAMALCLTLVACNTTADDGIVYEEDKTPPVTKTYLGSFRVTAYCPCELCCGYFANERPKDEFGNPIIYTASMNIAEEGVTIAADVSMLPFGTVLEVGGHRYTVQDRGGAIKGYRLDIYFENHEDVEAFGTKQLDVYRIEYD